MLKCKNTVDKRLFLLFETLGTKRVSYLLEEQHSHLFCISTDIHFLKYIYAAN